MFQSPRAFAQSLLYLSREVPAQLSVTANDSHPELLQNLEVHVGRETLSTAHPRKGQRRGYFKWWVDHADYVGDQVYNGIALECRCICPPEVVSMPMLLELVNARPDDAISQAIKDTVDRAKDVWGLDYAEDSNGLYPAGNEIGRSQLRVDQCFDRTAAQGQSNSVRRNGGRWATVTGATTLTGITPTDTDAGGGWVDWLSFTVDRDAFIVWEGVFNWDVSPSVHEVKGTLSGVVIPPVNVDTIYTYERPQGYFEVPAAISPSAGMLVRARSHLVGGNLVEQFGLLGDTVAKRSYLILEVY